MPNHRHPSRKPKRQSLSFEARLRVTFTIGAVILMGALAALLALLHVSTGPMLATLGILLLVLLLVLSALIEQAVRPIQTLANVVAALREEDYSFRARGANREDAMGQLSLEINALADTLQAQRVGALVDIAYTAGGDGREHGGAVSASEIAARAEALRPVERTSRRAQVAAYNAYVEERERGGA